MIRLLAFLSLILAPVLAQLPPSYDAFVGARERGDIAALENLSGEQGYVRILAARELSRQPGLSPGRRLELAELAARFDGSAADWIWVGRLREVLGDVAGAAMAYGNALPGDEAEEALARLAASGVRKVYQILFDKRSYSRLLAVLPPDEETWRARALLRLRRYREALPLYRRWAQKEPSGRLGLGWALFGLGHFGEAAGVFRSVAGAEGKYGLGRAYEALGKAMEAVRAYQESGRPGALWRATALLERQGRIAEALLLYRRLARSGSDYADDATLRIWVLARRRGDKATETWAYEQLQGGLAVLAGKPGPRPPGRGSPLETPPRLAEKVRRLLDSGRADWAWGEARWQARRFLAEGRVAAAWSVVALLEHLGMWGKGLRLAGEIPFDGRDGRFWRLLYPRAYPREVAAAAREFGLEPELIWAVMRVESRFDPRAVSPTGARGLMQFTAATWKDVAKRLGSPGASPFDVASAVRFGAYYLAHLLEGCGLQIVCALTGYNGGPGYTRRALDAVRGDVWDFMRFQPRDEPREYVERVLRVYAVYKRLYR